MFKRFLLLKAIPLNMDAALLAIRVIAVTSILLRHGLEKIFGYSSSLAWLVRSHHYVAAIGAGPSMFCATVADGFLTVLMIVGIATRWCAFLTLINLLVAWTLVLKMPYFGLGEEPLHGEIIIAYVACAVALILAGPGKYSIDAWLDRDRSGKLAEDNSPAIHAV